MAERSQFVLTLLPEIDDKKILSDIQKIRGELAKLDTPARGTNVPANQRRQVIANTAGLERRVTQGDPNERRRIRSAQDKDAAFNRALQRQAEATAALAQTSRVNVGRELTPRESRAFRDVGRQGLERSVGRQLTRTEAQQFGRLASNQFNELSKALPLDDLDVAARRLRNSINTLVPTGARTTLLPESERVGLKTVRDQRIPARPTAAEGEQFAQSELVTSLKRVSAAYNKQAGAIEGILPKVNQGERDLVAALKRKIRALGRQTAIITNTTKKLGPAERNLITGTAAAGQSAKRSAREVKRAQPPLPQGPLALPRAGETGRGALIEDPAAVRAARRREAQERRVAAIRDREARRVLPERTFQAGTTAGSTQTTLDARREQEAARQAAIQKATTGEYAQRLAAEEAFNNVMAARRAEIESAKRAEAGVLKETATAAALRKQVVSGDIGPVRAVRNVNAERQALGKAPLTEAEQALAQQYFREAEIQGIFSNTRASLQERINTQLSRSIARREAMAQREAAAQAEYVASVVKANRTYATELTRSVAAGQLSPEGAGISYRRVTGFSEDQFRLSKVGDQFTQAGVQAADAARRLGDASRRMSAADDPVVASFKGLQLSAEALSKSLSVLGTQGANAARDVRGQRRNPIITSGTRQEAFLSAARGGAFANAPSTDQLRRLGELRRIAAVSQTGILAGQGYKPTGQQALDAKDAASARVDQAFTKALADDILWLEGFGDALAAATSTTIAHDEALRGDAYQNIARDPAQRTRYISGRANRVVAQEVLGNDTAAAVIQSETLLRQRLVSILQTRLGLEADAATQTATTIASEVQSVAATEGLEAAELRLSAVLEREAAARTAGRSADKRLAAEETRLAQAYTEKGRDLIAVREQRSLIEKEIREGVRTQKNRGPGFFGRFTHALGYDRGGSSNPLQFFGGGALASIRYGLPSLLLYGGISGIGNLVQETEELEFNLKRLEGQFQALYGSLDGFGQVRGQILDIAKATGLQADQIAELRVQLTGAFGSGVEIAGLSGEDLVAKQTEDAAKLAQTVGLPLSEVTDGLTAASLAFDSSFEQIGDVALKIEQESGVLAKETVSFIGDIAPVAEEAGYSLEEFSAIAAVAQQRSGRSGTALAEAFGRVIPALTKNKDKLLELAAADRALGTPAFVDAVRNSDISTIFDEIGKSYAGLTEENKQLVVQLLGGRREAGAILPALTNRDLVDDYTKAAEDSADTLETRFQQITETLTNLKQRVGETFKEFGIAILDSGIIEGMETILNTFSGLLNILTPAIELLGKFNDIFSGIPSTVLLGVAALALFNKTIDAIKTRPKLDQYGVPVRDDYGRIERVNRFNRPPGGYGRSFLAETRFGQAYAANYAQQMQAGRYAPAFGDTRQRRYLGQTFGQRLRGFNDSQGPVRGVRELFARGERNPARNVSRLRATGAGLSATALSGFGGFIGLTAVTLAYGKVVSQIQKDKDALRKIDEDIAKANADIDLTSQSVRRSRIADLEAEARQATEDLSTWDRVWDAITGTQSEAERFLVGAEALRASPQLYSDLKALQQDTSAVDELEKNLPKLGRPTGGLRDLLGGELTYKDGKIQSGLIGIGDQDQAYLDEIARLGGIDLNDFNVGGDIEAAAEEGFQFLFDQVSKDGQDLGKIIDTALGEAEDATPATTEYARNFLESLLGEVDDSTLRRIRAYEEDILPAETARLDFENLKKALQLGVISREKFLEQAGASVDELSRLIGVGDTEAAQQERLEIIAKTQEYNDAVDKDLLGRQKALMEVAEAYGKDEKEINREQFDISLGNLALDETGLQSTEERLSAAAEVTKLAGQVALDRAKAANDYVEYNRILAEGFEVPPEARAEFTLAIQRANDFWSDVSQSYLDILGTPLEVESDLPDHLTKAAPPEFGSLEDFSRSLFQDIFESGTISRGGRSDVEREIRRAAVSWVEADSEEEKKRYEELISYFIAILREGGVSQAEIDTLISSLNFGPVAGGRVREGAGKYLNVVADSIAEVSDDIADEEEKKADAFLRVIEAQNYGNSRVINAAKVNAARIKKERARAKYGEDSPEYINAFADELEAANQQRIDDINRVVQDFEADATIAEAYGQDIRGLDAKISAAKYAYDNAFPDEKKSTYASLVQAQQERAKRIEQITQDNYSLMAATAEFDGNLIGAAQVRVAAAEEALRVADPFERAAATEQLLSARKALEEAQRAQRDAQFALFSTIIAREDPVAQAKVDLRLAEIQFGEAKGIQAKAEAQKRLVEVQRQLTSAMNEVRYSTFNLRQAELQALEDDVGAAAVAAQLARAQLADAQAAGVGGAEINNLRAQVITADKAARDAVFQDRMDDYSYMYEMEQITRSQYINYLEGLKSTLIPGTKQFKDLELQIKRLKDDISGDLQANLPTSLALPTLYEVRRFDQTPTSVGGPSAGTAIGYQDNRQMDIKITIGQNMSEGEIVDVLGKALGTGTSGYSPRRY